MSNVSNRHSVVPFVSGESKPLSGQRLARVGYKKTKEQPNPLPSVCASIPFLPVPSQEQLNALLPHIGNLLESAQDGIFRSLYEASSGNLGTLTDEDIGIDACISYLNAQASGGKLSGDQIKAWFVSTLEDDLIALVATKLKFAEITEENLPVIQKHVSAYRDLFASLAGYKGTMQEKQRNGLLVALDLAPSGDPMASRLRDRIKSMEEKSKEDLLELL
jgi:hypothetical protein